MAVDEAPGGNLLERTVALEDLSGRVEVGDHNSAVGVSAVQQRVGA